MTQSIFKKRQADDVTALTKGQFEQFKVLFKSMENDSEDDVRKHLAYINRNGVVIQWWGTPKDVSGMIACYIASGLNL